MSEFDPTYPRYALKTWLTEHRELAKKPDHGEGPKLLPRVGPYTKYVCGCGESYYFTDFQQMLDPKTYISFDVSEGTE